METAPAPAPECFAFGGGAAAAPETMRSSDVTEQFSVEEFFDFSNEVGDADDLLLFPDNTNANEFQSIFADSSSSVNLLELDCKSSMGDFGNSNLTSELCVPYDDPAELEWVSQFVEETFSSEDMEKLQFISGMSARPDEPASATNESRLGPNSTKSQPEILVPGKARSKRPRTTSGNWTSRLDLVCTPESEIDPNPTKKPKTVRKYGPEYLPVDGRKCQHCQTDKTPQWRTGPNGPKTLCNACGVRFKTGRLVPEYRPASSPTFVQTEHSNSHRKVMELRRQKEMMMTGTHQQNRRYLEQYRNMWIDRSNGEDYLIHRRVDFEIEPDFGQLI
ncbi:unnamed protein product [Rhodiola kirilowii]